MVLNPPDATDLCPTATAKAMSQRASRLRNALRPENQKGDDQNHDDVRRLK